MLLGSEYIREPFSSHPYHQLQKGERHEADKRLFTHFHALRY